MIANSTMDSNRSAAFSAIWGLIDYLISGDMYQIEDLIRMHLTANNEPEETFQARLNNLWLPHHYTTQLREMVGKILDTDRMTITGISDKIWQDFDGAGSSLDTFLGHGLESMINYGGVVTVALPINGRFVLKQVLGKNIVESSVNEAGVVEYFKWRNYEESYSIAEDTVERCWVHYAYILNSNDEVLLRREVLGQYELDNYHSHDGDIEVIPINGKDKIPLVGTQIPVNDEMRFRGTPFLLTLALACGRLALNSANIDYLLEQVMSPRLVYKGATPIKKLKSSRWRGINIGMHDTLEYLEHGGGSLDAAKSQLDRYSADIKSMNPISTINDTSNDKTAFEVSLINARETTMRIYIIERVLRYMTDIFKLSTEYKVNNLTRAKITYKKIHMDQAVVANQPIDEGKSQQVKPVDKEAN